MVSDIDEGKGLVKVCWADVRKRVAKVEPTFAKLVDEISPDKSFPLYLAYYPYGALKGDTISTFLPDNQGGYYRLNDPNVPKDVMKDLGYGKESAPLGMLLEKNLELFVDLKSIGTVIPKAIYRPGMFFPLTKILTSHDRTYAPNGVLTISSGVRSVFMLPNIGCATQHSNLYRDFNIKNSTPKSFYDHWGIFKEIVNCKIINSSWRSCLLYFGEEWLDKIKNDNQWLNVKMYFYKLGWDYSEFSRNQFYYDLSFSLFQKLRNLKPNPYLVDTAKYLFNIALGDAPGYAPTENDAGIPVDILQKVFVESYNIKKYIPTIMQLTHLFFGKNIHPVYYSLQYPTMNDFSPKSRKISTVMYEMRELEYIANIFIEELIKKGGPCADSFINIIAKSVEFNYFHNKIDRHSTARLSNEVLLGDPRFLYVGNSIRDHQGVFASDASFLRGCISVNFK